MKLGTTFSHVHAASLGLDVQESLGLLKNTGLTHLRLGLYWNQIQPEKNIWKWEEMDTLIKLAADLGFEIILTVGQKAPRWPEFYIPDWVSMEERKSCLEEFITKSVTRYDHYLEVWQLENEPLDPSGPNHAVISMEDLNQELYLLRTFTQKPILITVWGNTLKSRYGWKNLVKSSVTIVGLDIYFGQPNSNPIMKTVRPYIGPEGKAIDWETWGLTIRQQKNLWISELQAEPWSDELVCTDPEHPSCTPQLLEKWLAEIMVFKPDVVLLWGSEYWLWREKQGDERWMEAVRALVH